MIQISVFIANSPVNFTNTLRLGRSGQWSSLKMNNLQCVSFLRIVFDRIYFSLVYSTYLRHLKPTKI